MFQPSRLRSQRKRKKLSQEQLAKLTNTTKATISNYENAYSKPNDEMLVKLAIALETSVDYFLDLSDNPAPKNKPSDPSMDDLKNTLQALKEKRARWGARKLSDSEQEMLEKILKAVIKREEDEEDAEQ